MNDEFLFRMDNLIENTVFLATYYQKNWQETEEVYAFSVLSLQNKVYYVRQIKVGEQCGKISIRYKRSNICNKIS